MTEGKDLLGPLREADREMSRATLAPRARKRIAARLDEASEAPTARDHGKRRALLAVTAAAATFAALAVWRGHREAGDGQRAAASGRLAGFAWQGDQCSALPRAGALLLDGTCRADLDELGVVITSRGAAQLVRVEAGVRLVHGTADFEVERVAVDQPPVRIAVSAGVIEVTGTRFTVVQEPGRGHVQLHEGRIQFRATDQTVTVIEPGHRLAWVDPAREARADGGDAATITAAPTTAAPTTAAPPVTTPSPSTPTPSTPTTTDTRRPADHSAATPPSAPRSPSATTLPPPDAIAPPAAAAQLPAPPDVGVATHIPDEAAASVIDRVLALRAERRYGEAAELLHQAGRRSWRPSTAELLSYEEGDIRARLPDRAAACDHWRLHRARFPGGLHAAAIDRSMKRLACR